MTISKENPTGRVCLIGAGPGDEGLITVLGLRMLRLADVVVYDMLANPRLLNEVRPDAEYVPVGIRGEPDKLSQDQINALLIDRAKQGYFVVRLKGGDPYLFGRGAEEVAAVTRSGIGCQVVPGVTSGIAAPMAAGIPVSRRDVASTVTFVTGHEDPTKGQAQVDYRALAELIQAGGTVCFFMAVGRWQEITDALHGYGAVAQTPVAVVERGFTPLQRCIRSDLAKATKAMKQANLKSPAIMVVGPVAAISEPGLEFYIQRPLFSQRVVITRTRHQASKLYDLLSELGAHVLEAPTIEFKPPKDWGQIDKAITHLDQFDWLVLTSVNGVEALAKRLGFLSLDARDLAGVKVAAIGDATESELQARLGIQADLVPPHYVAESLGQQLIDAGFVKDRKFLLLRADIARPKLREMLNQAGGHVKDLAIYETKRAERLSSDVLAALRCKEVDWMTFTSSSTATNMAEMLGSECDLIQDLKIASIGPITSQTVRDLGWTLNVEADPSNLRGLVAAMVQANQANAKC